METFTVYENIVLPLQIQGKNIKKHQDKIEEILDKLAIQNLKDKFPNQLSGGQRQRGNYVEPWLMILNWLSQMSRQEPWTLPILKNWWHFCRKSIKVLVLPFYWLRMTLPQPSILHGWCYLAMERLWMIWNVTAYLMNSICKRFTAVPDRGGVCIQNWFYEMYFQKFTDLYHLFFQSDLDL